MEKNWGRMRQRMPVGCGNGQAVIAETRKAIRAGKNTVPKRGGLKNGSVPISIKN